MSAFVRIWSYRVAPEHAAEFERIYGPAGDWAALFSRGEGYLGTELLRREPGAYVTLDRWRSRDDWRRFRETHRVDYEALDRRSEALTESETDLGEHEAVV